MSVKDGNAPVRKQRLCYGCLAKDMQSKIVKAMGAVSMDAQMIATLRKPNGRGQSRSQRKRSNNQPE